MIAQKVTSINNEVEKVEFISMRRLFNDFHYYSTNANYDLIINNNGFTLNNSKSGIIYSYEIINKKMSDIIL